MFFCRPGPGIVINGSGSTTCPLIKHQPGRPVLMQLRYPFYFSLVSARRLDPLETQYVKSTHGGCRPPDHPLHSKGPPPPRPLYRGAATPKTPHAGDLEWGRPPTLQSRCLVDASCSGEPSWKTRDGIEHAPWCETRKRISDRQNCLKRAPILRYFDGRPKSEVQRVPPKSFSPRSPLCRPRLVAICKGKF